ncbi:membrane-associated protein [Natrarchaeobius halalkaliphilus]|uniref:Membrane-associated protein n=1 Tax=Natrarchaeobius halalkaliphilus TaxID=1679091 RepID=A0A3N6LSN2_9EURY|nr:VTT domain-containing protein [Natrarchaeobius halalkaliphilus]RQG90314.1 membrane-associated protein [Natrarchaeobius halalkaliphilus]
MPVSGQLIDLAFSLLLVFDEPALFLLFVLKGAIIGKVFPTSLFLPGYLLAIKASSEQIAVGIVVASFGYVTGQLLIYWISNNYGTTAVGSLPAVSVSDEQVTRAEELFQRYSGMGIFITNLVPFVGSFIMIPAGMTSYSIPLTILYALSSTVLNYILIVLIAFESLEFLSLL